VDHVSDDAPHSAVHIRRRIHTHPLVAIGTKAPPGNHSSSPDNHDVRHRFVCESTEIVRRHLYPHYYSLRNVRLLANSFETLVAVVDTHLCLGHIENHGDDDTENRNEGGFEMNLLAYVTYRSDRCHLYHLLVLLPLLPQPICHIPIEREEVVHPPNSTRIWLQMQPLQLLPRDWREKAELALTLALLCPSAKNPLLDARKDSPYLHSHYSETMDL
jgi:hypothetical protein